MTTTSIIGSGNMATAIGARAAKHGHAGLGPGRDAARAKDLAAALGGGATAGTFDTAPAGDIVILAVPYASAVPVVAQYGDVQEPDQRGEDRPVGPVEPGTSGTPHPYLNQMARMPYVCRRD